MCVPVPPFYRGYPDSPVQMSRGSDWCRLRASCWYVEHCMHGELLWQAGYLFVAWLLNVPGSRRVYVRDWFVGTVLSNATPRWKWQFRHLTESQWTDTSPANYVLPNTLQNSKQNGKFKWLVWLSWEANSGPSTLEAYAYSARLLQQSGLAALTVILSGQSKKKRWNAEAFIYTKQYFQQQKGHLYFEIVVTIRALNLSCLILSLKNEKHYEKSCSRMKTVLF